jgi:hypothetical protein
LLILFNWFFEIGKMSYTDPQKAQIVVWFIEEDQSHANLQRRIRREENNRYAQVTALATVKNWVNDFLATGSVHGQSGKNQPT